MLVCVVLVCCVDLVFWIFLVKLRYFVYLGCIWGNCVRVVLFWIVCGDILFWRFGARLMMNVFVMFRCGVDGGGI